MTETIAVAMAVPADGSSFGVAPWHMNVNVFFIKRGGSMPKVSRESAHMTMRR